ncbi:MAG: transporter substrate-binding domain-containing protein, partial [Pseudomonadota bacterium]|nr:transporter substrate-binding domain-containing protein [Pseudomonadota bacterium]
ANSAGPRLPDCSRPLSLGLHEHGLLYTGQTGEGIDKDIADEMVRRSGCRLTLTVLPRARIWQLVESGALDLTLSGISTAERDKFAAFAWYVSNKYYLLVRRDADVHSAGEFRRKRGLRLGLIRSFRYGEQANTFVDAIEAEERITYAGSLEPLYTILLDDGIQAMIIEPFDFPVIAGAQLKAQTAILEFGDAPVPHGLVMSRKSLAPAQLAAWRDLIQSMRADGTIRRIFEKYFPADLARQMTQF